LLLFYKIGRVAAAWWGMLMTSTDEGQTWSTPKRLPDGILGPIKNKPVELPDKSLLCGSSSEQDNWRVYMERTTDAGETWTQTPALNDGHRLEAIQPTILNYPSGKIQILCRTKQHRLAESWSADRGKSWGTMQLTQLPNPNSGVDGVVLHDGCALLVYNDSVEGRTQLKVAVSADGKDWAARWTLEDQPGEYSYPAIIQTSDGLVHITYTWHRTRIKHVVLDPK
jgi:predicted neuraminidase